MDASMVNQPLFDIIPVPKASLFAASHDCLNQQLYFVQATSQVTHS